jgi:hypothetical protein
MIEISQMPLELTVDCAFSLDVPGSATQSTAVSRHDPIGAEIIAEFGW